ncbi:MAG: hypothetical protein IKS85_05015, partial [Lachnospiraceae bacterium]|nr:hypothetical protein [Lachnospiraceae bacterium]
GLGLLAKAGSVGNGIAVALWIGVCAIPAVLAFGYGRGKDVRLERISLFVLSGVLLLSLYGMVNPHVFYPALASNSIEYQGLVKAIFGITIWATVILFLILRLIRFLRQGNKEQLLKYVRLALYALCILFAAKAVTPFTDGISTLLSPEQVTLDKVIGVLRIIAGSLPYVLGIAVMLRAMALLELAAKESQDGIAEAAQRVSQFSCTALGIMTMTSAAFNLIQIVAMRWLSNVLVSLEIPVISIAFVVMILLFTRLLIENKKLQDDNNLFI